ncbi:hypothetical protein CEXT_183531 [Caerostris extrusa]|uniref:Uncharacterized protein n=1 Tax=Caerostris extrusa TaxID=172846 RepID=A0AAV4MBP8_CAEEX|nr:hypothetical protein CEXT_183531 [Caerostris extrusa]
MTTIPRFTSLCFSECWEYKDNSLTPFINPDIYQVTLYNLSRDLPLSSETERNLLEKDFLISPGTFFG